MSRGAHSLHGTARYYFVAGVNDISKRTGKDSITYIELFVLWFQSPERLQVGSGNPWSAVGLGQFEPSQGNAASPEDPAKSNTLVLNPGIATPVVKSTSEERLQCYCVT